MLKYDLNLREYWRIIKRRKFIILFTCMIMGVFSFISAILNKPAPIYRTSATVKVEKTPPMMGFSTPSYGGTNLETQTIMIKSYYILELTAKKMGMIPETLSSEDVRNNPQYIGIILDLKNKVKAEQEGGSDLINIDITANDPKFATHFANTLAAIYQQQHTQELNRRTIEGKKFVEGQFIAAKERMTKSEEAIKKFREDNKWTSVESESSYTLGEVKRLKSQLNQDQIILHKLLIAERTLVNAESQPLSSKNSFYFEEASPPYKALNDKLVGYMVDRDTLLLTYTDNFPQLQAIRSQVNDAIAGMKTQLRLQKNNLVSNQQILRRQIAEFEEQFKRLPEKGLELTKLEREAGINREVYTLLEKKYQEILIAEAEKLEEVKIVKPALEPMAPTNPPKIANNAAIGTLMGLILGVVFAFLIETFDTSIGAIEEVEEFLGIHVLGVIPFVSPEEVRLLLSDDKGNLTVEEHRLPRYIRMASHFVPSSTLSESYKAFRTNLNFVCLENNYKTVVLTSSSPGEGKTSTIVNLALTMAQTGHKVLLIDGDLRRPVISSLFGVEQTPGLTDVIMGNYEWRNVVKNISDFMMGQMTVEEVVLTPGLDNLNIISSGTHAPNPAEIIGSKSIAEFMRQVRNDYDMVLVDAPPVLAATDAALWSIQVDATVLVYQVGKIARGALKRAKMQLAAIKTNIIGVVLNGIRADISNDFTYQDYYYYHYRYGSGRVKKKTPWYKAILENTLLARIMNYGLLYKKRYHHRRKMTDGSNNKAAPASEASAGTASANSRAAEASINPAARAEVAKEAIKWRFLQKLLPFIKILVAILAVLFLALGILYQGGFLKTYLSGNSKAKSTKSSMRPIPLSAGTAAPSAINPPMNSPHPTSPGGGAVATGTASLPPEPTDNTKSKVPSAAEIASNPAGTATLTGGKSGHTSPTTGAATATAMAMPENAKTKPEKSPPINAHQPFTIQIKAVSNKNQAVKIVNSLRDAGLKVHTEMVTIGNTGHWTRIFIGGFATREEARKYMQDQNLDQRFQGAFIVKR